MVALTYDVRTVHVPIPRLVIGVRRSRQPRLPAPVAHRPHWVRTERATAEHRREAHRDAALAVRSGAGY
jgi:hypothetical protein